MTPPRTGRDTTPLACRAPVNLTVDHLSSPIGVAVPRPVLAWQVPGPAPARAYEIEVRRLDPAGGAAPEPAWATGRVEIASPPMSPWVAYDGAPLVSDADYSWRVRVWTADAGPSDWAASAFSTSLLHPGSDAVAPWVEPAQTPAEPEPPIDFAAVFGEDGGQRAWEPAGRRLHPVKLVRQELAPTAPAASDAAEPGDAPPAPAALTRARLYTTAQGVLDVSIDGAPVGDSVLAPGWTSYHDYTEFDVHDVTAALASPGPHVLGLRLADGWFAGRIGALGESAQYGRVLRAWWQLSLTYADGSTAVVGPDATARSTEGGPIRYSDILVGERRDDRLAAAVAGWDRPGFDDGAWDRVWIVPTARLEPTTRLEPFRGEPARRVRALPVARVLTTPAGETVLDLGQVIAGRVRLAAVGPAGTEIVLEHSEHLAADGSFFSNVVGPNKDQRDVWVLAGTGTPEAPEVFEPAFTFHGFRYVRVTGYPGRLRARDAVGVVLASDLPATGGFACSDARLTRLHKNVVWSQRANFLWIPTDCPQRERTGWTGDAQVFAPAAANNAEVHAFLARWMRNVRADQREDGSVMNMSPWPPLMGAVEGIPGPGGIVVSAGWGDAVIRVPLALWERYGDTTALEENLGAMRSWVAKQTREADRELPERLRAEAGGPADGWERLSGEEAARQRLLWNSRTHFGDWLAPSTLAADVPLPIMEAPRRTGEFVASAYHAEALRTLARVEGALGHEREAAGLRERWEAVRGAVAAEYVSADGVVSSGLQGEQVLALAFDLVADRALRDRVAERLAELVRGAGGRLDTGFLSTPFLLDVLVDSGHEAEAWAVLMQEAVPSWLYEVAEGATTIWESWAAVAPDGTVGAMSFNHCALGCVDDWMFRRLGGIAPLEPGYRRVRVAPLTGGPVFWARAHRDTPFGRVKVSWERTGPAAPGDASGTGAGVNRTGADAVGAHSRVRYEIELPAGVSGELMTPDGRVRELRGGRTVEVCAAADTAPAL